MKYRIVELNEDRSIKKIWFESNNITAKKNDEIECYYMGTLKKLDDQYNLYGKALKTEISEDGGETWSFYRDTTIDYWKL